MADSVGRSAADRLTPREQEVLELLRVGLPDAEIAERLSVSIPAVRRHVSAIIGKLDVRNRYEAAAWPERPPWWASAFAPVGFLWRQGTTAAQVPMGSVAMGISGVAFAAALAGLGLIAFLLQGSSGGAGAEGGNEALAASLPVLGRDAGSESVEIETNAGSRHEATRLAFRPAASLSPPNTPTTTPSPALSPPNTPTPSQPSPAATDPAPSHTPRPTSTPDRTTTPLPTAGPPDRTATPVPATTTPAATATPDCRLAPGELVVYFAIGADPQRIDEILQEVEAILIPLLLPLPLIEGAFLAELIAIAEGEELAIAAQLEAHDEVVAATNEACLDGVLPSLG